MKVNVSHGTGPFYRVTSVPGFSFLQGDVYLPGGTDVRVRDDDGNPLASGDTAYIYTGGWSTTGHAADAGFQYSPVTDSWSAFIRSQDGSVATSPIRFDGSQTLGVAFHVESDDVLTLSCVGRDTKYISRTVGLTLAVPGSGWKKNGHNTLKRVISIGQSKEDFKSGAHLTRASWRNTVLGHNAPAPPWLPEHTATREAWPVSIEVITPTPRGEYVNINLGPPLVPA